MVKLPARGATNGGYLQGCNSNLGSTHRQALGSSDRFHPLTRAGHVGVSLGH